MITHGILWTYEHYSEFWTLFLAYLEENKCTDIIHWRKHHTQHSQMLSSSHERHTCSPEWECKATSFKLRGWRTSNNHIIGQNPWCVKEGPAVISLVMLLHNVWSYAIQSEISLIKITDNHISRVSWPPVWLYPTSTNMTIYPMSASKESVMHVSSGYSPSFRCGSCLLFITGIVLDSGED